VRAQRLPLHTHNGPLQIWLELGLVGALLATALVLALGWQATSPGSAGAFACAIAIASLSYGVWQGWWLCLLAMLALVSRQLTREPPPR
jgi:O-antigen ligase